MQLATVRFDRLFDIGYQNFPKRRYTFFSFQHGEALHYGVRMPGKLRLKSGMVVTACLLKQDDWRTLAGWYDHSSGKTVTANPAVAIWTALATIWMTAFWIRHEVPSHAGAWVMLAFLVLLSIANARWLFALFRIRSALKSCADGGRDQRREPAS